MLQKGTIRLSDQWRKVAVLTEDGAFALFWGGEGGIEWCITGAEGKALHKPDVCEAKQPKENYSIKRNTSVQQTLWEPRE